MVRNKLSNVSRNLPQVRDVVIHTDGELGLLGCNQIACPSQGMRFRAFDIHFDERDSLVGQNVIQRDNMRAALANPERALCLRDTEVDVTFAIPNAKVEGRDAVMVRHVADIFFQPAIVERFKFECMDGLKVSLSCGDKLANCIAVVGAYIDIALPTRESDDIRGEVLMRIANRRHEPDIPVATQDAPEDGIENLHGSLIGKAASREAKLGGHDLIVLLVQECRSDQVVLVDEMD